MINQCETWRKCSTLISRDLFEYNIWIEFRMTLIRACRRNGSSNYANSTLCSTLVLHQVYMPLILLMHFLSTVMDSPRILGRDFTRPFDHQRRNARAKVRVEMPLTLKCAILYGALLCWESSIESLSSVCTDKSVFECSQERGICKWQNQT